MWTLSSLRLDKSHKSIRRPRAMAAWALALGLALITGTVSSGDDFFGDEFNEEFDAMEDSDRFHDKLEDGFKNWEERCLEIGGQEVLDAYLREQEQLVYCAMEQFDLDQLQQEIEEKQKVGDLDEVFQKYCRDHVSAARSCLQKFLEVSQQCLREEDRPGLNVTLQMVDSAIAFTCHNSGDRIALFMSEEGVECVTTHKEEILACINQSVPEVFNTYNNLHNYKMHFYVFQQENCRKGDAIMQCVETSLMKCPDPTPSNLVHGLLKAMKEGTPCGAAAQSWHTGGSDHLRLGITALLVTVLRLSL